MKQIILSMLALASAGITTSMAGGVFVPAARQNNYVVGGYPAPHVRNYYPSQYSHSSGPDYSYGHQPYHQDPQGQHQDLHGNVEGLRNDLKRDRKRVLEAVHQDLRRQRAYGVPEWQREEQRRVAHQQVRELRHADQAALEQLHREGHYYLGR